MRGVGRLGAGDGNRLAGNAEDVAGTGADAIEIGGGETRDGMRDVLDARFGDAEREGRRGARDARIAMAPPRTSSGFCRAKRSNTAASGGSAAACAGWRSIATRVSSSLMATSVMVPSVVCSIAQPSALTDVTAIDRRDASLSHGTTSAVTWPCARAYSSMARDTTPADPDAVNSIMLD